LKLLLKLRLILGNEMSLSASLLGVKCAAGGDKPNSVVDGHFSHPAEAKRPA
jgi:hypothetical protein